MILVLFLMADDTGWISGSNRIVLEIVIDYRTGCYHTIISDAHTRYNYRAGTYPCPAAYTYVSAQRGMGRNMHEILDNAFVVNRSARIYYAMFSYF